MKNHLIIKCIVIIACIACYYGGKRRGSSEGYIEAMTQVNASMDSMCKNDTCTSMLVLMSTDTNIYIVRRK